MLPKLRPADEPERVPDRLYHYTSIEALAMILSTRKLRFTRLDLVNDPEEAISHDLNISRELVFASCWGGDEEESLPMWKMYTPAKRGVRISLPWDFLSHYRCDESKDIHNYVFALNELMPIMRESGSARYTSSVFGPYKMVYTKSDEAHKSSCITEVDKIKKFTVRDLGTKKKRHWEFEQEWRFKVSGVQTDAIYDPESDDSKFIEEMFDSNNHVTTRHVYAPLSEDALQKMHIMIGPSPDPSTEILVNALLRSEGVDAIVMHSNISINW
ncbi:DUF2971 domain-containing protein [Zoogloea sp.]|uniref:DUF2971 domain-containing protein n=1 Tax=Zoogloea sp. TaxID=49181 RepID=UPI001416BAA8|nr:MAG: DUF2971 domain-containing protein [Zoogloea sp.]